MSVDKKRQRSLLGVALAVTAAAVFLVLPASAVDYFVPVDFYVTNCYEIPFANCRVDITLYDDNQQPTGYSYVDYTDQDGFVSFLIDQVGACYYIELTTTVNSKTSATRNLYYQCPEVDGNDTCCGEWATPSFPGPPGTCSWYDRFGEEYEYVQIRHFIGGGGPGAGQ